MNVSHRDIKPENFVFENIASNNLKLIDFGLSSSFISVSEAKNKPFLLRMRTPVGTKIYVAPEVYQKEYTEKCDIWSAGVMLYALLCGYPPFLSENEDEIKRKIMRGKFKFGEDWDSISDEAKDLICKMLVPEKRRPTAKECLDHPWFSMDTHQLSCC
jgi:calcium-dependent protein kinase